MHIIISFTTTLTQLSKRISTTLNLIKIYLHCYLRSVHHITSVFDQLTGITTSGVWTPDVLQVLHSTS